MAMATCVLTCMNWFCMSRRSCLSSFSGSSALSTKSFRFALISVVTRSSNGILFPPSGPWCRAVSLPIGTRAVIDPPYLSQQFGHLHSRQRLKERRNLGCHFGHIASNFVHAGSSAFAGGHDCDLVYIGKRCR